MESKWAVNRISTASNVDIKLEEDRCTTCADCAGYFFECTGQKTQDKGVLWISTPNYNCAYARMQKFSHCMWHELNHYTYVSFETLKKLLENMQLDIVHYDMSSRYMGSTELFIQHTK